MEKPISDNAAVNFSANFYQVLASGGSIRQAFEGGRLVTMMQGREAFGKSDLLIRPGADPNETFIKLSPTMEAVVQPLRRDAPDATVSQNASGNSKVGAQTVVQGNHNTTNNNTSFHER
jgi:hypothetical protein